GVLVTVAEDCDDASLTDAVDAGSRAFDVLPMAAAASDREVLEDIARRPPGRDLAHGDAAVSPAPGWAEALLRAVSFGVGAVSPLSPGEALLDPFPSSPPEWMTPECAGRWLAELTRAHVFDVPVVLRACCW